MWTEAIWLKGLIEKNKRVAELLKGLSAANVVAQWRTAQIAKAMEGMSEILRMVEPYQALVRGISEEIQLVNSPEFKDFQSEFGWLDFMPSEFMFAFFRQYKDVGWNAAWQE